MAANAAEPTECEPLKETDEALKIENKEGSELLNSLVELQDSLEKPISPAAFVHSLSKPVQRRLKALKRLQRDFFDIEVKFYEELHVLEHKYELQYSSLYDKRYKIVSAEVEPADEDCDWPSDGEDSLPEELQEKLKVQLQDDSQSGDAVEQKGIPDFWLRIFKNMELLTPMIRDSDEPILKHLTDVRVKTSLKEPVGFTLEFVFEPNEYFTNEVLTKEYLMKFGIDGEAPLEYDGPEIVKCKGSVIDWKPGMNVTQKKVKKVQQHRTHPGAKRTVVKTIQAESFFNFFSPPEVIDGTEPDEETEELLSNDFEIAQCLRDQVIPKAVLYFTGEALDYSDSEEDDSEDGQHDSVDPSADEM